MESGTDLEKQLYGAYQKPGSGLRNILCINSFDPQSCLFNNFTHFRDKVQKGSRPKVMCI